MQEIDIKRKCTDFSASGHGQTDRAGILDMARAFHVGRNTVANIARELSISFKYEDLQGKTRAYVYNDEADRIRRVLREKYE